MEYYEIVLTFVEAFLFCALFTSRAIPQLTKLKAGQSIREDGPKSHMAKSGTPTMGGIAIIFAVLLSSVIRLAFDRDLIVILIGFVLFGILGFLDDFIKVMKKHNLGLTALQKLILQIIIAFFASFYYLKTAENPTKIWVPFFDFNFDLGIFFLPFAVFVIVAMANSVNLTDGLDGLAAGTSAIASLAFAAVSLKMQAYQSAVFFFAVAGACAGFLLFNKNPAKIFMGDTGSLALGGGMAIAALNSKVELLLPIIGLVFVLETLSVIIQVVSFKLRGKRVFKMAPVHHHFELCGMSEKKVVYLFYLFVAACSGICLAIVFI
ncbi:MAG: phospho-N-acetylmuramoyl-pentapeptide-transferase [Eubacteriales bacterium]